MKPAKVLTFPAGPTHQPAAPPEPRDITGRITLREFAAAINPSGGALGDALPFSLRPPVARTPQPRQPGLFETGVDDHDDQDPAE